MLEQYELELISLNERIEKLKNEINPLIKKRTQIKKNIFRYRWRKRKKKEKK